jgi:hypothetical protein
VSQRQLPTLLAALVCVVGPRFASAADCNGNGVTDECEIGLLFAGTKGDVGSELH